MLNHPFSSTNTNIFDERTFNSTPTNLYGQNVLVSQDQHRKIFDTLTTSVSQIPGIYPTMQQNFNNPNAVTFTFKTPQQSYPQNYWQCQAPPMQNLNQLQQQTAIDLLQLQKQLNQSFQCKFHLDSHTSTTDLGAKLEARPDFTNLAGIFQNKWPYWLQTPVISKNHKKLVLRKVTPKIKGTVYDEAAGQSNDTKRVSFEHERYKNQETQVELGCQCCINRASPKKLKEKKRKGRKKSSCSPSTSEASEDDDIR